MGERERETDRQTDKQMERERERERQTDRQTDGEREGDGERERERERKKKNVAVNLSDTFLKPYISEWSIVFPGSMLIACHVANRLRWNIMCPDNIMGAQWGYYTTQVKNLLCLFFG